jgi:tetratricopeptide (TPR) repeat protein
VAVFDQAIRANPSWYGPYLDKGICLSKLNRHDEALELLKIADALNPYNTELYFQTGNIYKMKGDYKMMHDYWQRALKYDRDNKKTLLGYGTFHIDDNNLDSALYYLTVLPDSIYEPEVFYYRGVIYLKKNDTGLAQRQFDQYLESGRDSAVRKDILRFREGIQ